MFLVLVKHCYLQRCLITRCRDAFSYQLTRTINKDGKEVNCNIYCKNLSAFLAQLRDKWVQWLNTAHFSVTQPSPGLWDYVSVRRLYFIHFFFLRVRDNQMAVPLRTQRFPEAKKLVNSQWVNESLESRRENKLGGSGERCMAIH